MKFTDEQVDAALAALAEPERFTGAEERLAPLLPQLQRILSEALAAGGFFEDAHEAELRKALGAEDAQEREARIRTMLAEETRIGMLIGVAVGWELREELATKENS